MHGLLSRRILFQVGFGLATEIKEDENKVKVMGGE